MAKSDKVTPMMQQYRAARNQLPPEALLLFRLGDFYEMFFDDARIAAGILNVALTKRGTTPMCGVPFHAAEGYISKLLQAGRKVALCDQVEEARPGQLVKREITQILSPGTHLDERMLDAGRNNFLAAVVESKGVYGLAIADLTTGDFRATQAEGSGALVAELERLRPTEIIHPEEDSELRKLLRTSFPLVGAYEDWTFSSENAEYALRQHFKVAGLEGFGLKDRPLATGAAGAVVHYLREHLRRDLRHFTTLRCYGPAEYMALDAITLRSLEILEPLHRDTPRDATLVGVINETSTPMGARLLREWLSHPLASVEGITARQDAVATWLDAARELEAFREKLGQVRDLERTLSRLSAGSGSGRDLAALRDALAGIPEMRELVELAARDAIAAQDASHLALGEATSGRGASSLLQELASGLTDLPELRALLESAIVDEPPALMKDGGLIREGYHADLDQLRSASRDGKDWIAALQTREMERTGVPSLKVRFNSVFGYYIEITRANLDKVPEDYIRKQTIANGERFITPELKEVEGRILGAEERAIKLEAELFQEVRGAVLEQLAPLQRMGKALASLDVLASFAELARIQGWCRPEVGEEGRLELVDARHPVLDRAVLEEPFVPNDTQLDPRDCQIALITGPNMAGKSTYIRQVALLALLAHTGCYLPAKSARVDLIDRIFTRIGASDNLAKGQSTFMVEMSETANILHHATPASLVILDEIGRGTSTFDGLSLAWSILEYLHHRSGSKTLFATHYHELSELAGRLSRVKNFNILVREYNDQIIFLRKIAEGGTDKSYGIQVARLAGVPQEVIDRARQVLANLEATELRPEGGGRRGSGSSGRQALKELEPTPQLDLFGWTSEG